MSRVPTTDSLAAWLGRLERRVDDLGRRSQLSYSSIQGTGIPVYDDEGTVRLIIGQQDDGTHGVVAVNGPPPGAPTPPVLTPVVGGLQVAWDGLLEGGAARTKDFLGVQVHMSADSGFAPSAATLQGWLPDTGSAIFATSTTDPTFVVLVAVNTSGASSPPSEEASGTGEGVPPPEIGPGSIHEEMLADAAVSVAKIADGAVDSAKLADLAVALGKIAAGAVDTTALADAAVAVAKIAAGAVTAPAIAASAVTATAIQAGAITTAKLAAGAVTANEIAANTITAAKIAADTITATQIAAGAITASELAANAVTATAIQAGAITTAKLAAGAVTATELAAGSVIAGKIAAGVITATEIAAGAITTPKIAAGAITASLISAGAIDGMTITGPLIRSAASGARWEIDGPNSRIRLYDTDGVTVLDELKPGGSTLTGRLQTGTSGQRLALEPSVTLLAGAGLTGFPTGEALLLYTGNAGEIGPGMVVAYDVGDSAGTGSGLQLRIVPPFKSSAAGTPTNDWVNQPTLQLTGKRADGTGALLIASNPGGQILLRQVATDMNDSSHDVVLSDSAGATTTAVIRNALGWTACTLGNSWTNFAGYQSARYTKLATGVVVVQGVITGGTLTTNTVLFTLPAGYRPANRQMFGCVGAGPQIVRVEVLANGQVLLGNAPNSNSFLSLNAIRFTAEA